jgi:predicted DNA-binding ribbon-helix-helix protein
MKVKSVVVKRTIVVGPRKTSVSVEAPFWQAGKEIAAHEGTTIIHQLVTRIDTVRRHANLSSAIRLYVLDYYVKLADEAAPGGGKGKR